MIRCAGIEGERIWINWSVPVIMYYVAGQYPPAGVDKQVARDIKTMNISPLSIEW